MLFCVHRIPYGSPYLVSLCHNPLPFSPTCACKLIACVCRTVFPKGNGGPHVLRLLGATVLSPPFVTPHEGRARGLIRLFVPSLLLVSLFMHRSTHGSSRSSCARNSALADVPASTTVAHARRISETYPRLVSPSMKLPELRAPAPILGSGNANASANVPECSRVLDDTRCAIRKTPREAVFPAAEDRLCLPFSLEPIKFTVQPFTSSKLLSSDDTSTLVLKKDVAELQKESHLCHTCTVESLLTRQRYVDVYFVASSLLTVGNRAAKMDAGEEKSRLHLLSHRCLCSYALLRFKECCEDGMTSLALYRHLQHDNSFSSLDMPDEVLHSRVAQALLGALVMRELYSDAAVLLESVPPVLDTLGDTTSKEFLGIPPPPLLFATTRQDALSSLASFRQCVAARRWVMAAQIIDGSTTAQSWVQATPLCAMLAFVRLEMDDPKAARALLLPYLASLPEPPSWETLSAAPVEHAQLWGDFTSHYVFSTTLLAKASFMSGSTYLNISAALLQRALRLSPSYAPARLFAEFVLSFEAQQQHVDAAVSSSDYPKALSVTAEMLRMPEVTRLVHAELYLVRTQAQWMIGQPLEVVDEASRCVQCDPQCALAFRLRADAFAMMSRETEAAADLVMAKHLNARVGALFDELRVQRSRYSAAQLEAEAKRNSVPVFKSFSSASAPLRSPPSESFGGCPRRSGAKARRLTNADLQPSLRTHYDVLGVSNNASEAEIRRRYHRLTLQLHPDRLVGAAESDRRSALEAFQLVGNAYSVLTDTQLRAVYDAGLPSLH
ncbi:conserved hypothetical protein [Leishmania mexicana MHOM/GT/2001/U1103]|uniref:J domain-containing protein n=1 Tax=Leishmania mexicana (strain MHOM/GT/2001/U1103) TaxID=929439 RepID=E9B5I0_LEIMU|nr:conserved hypothetical protein [Leishmania mexicana MHOM/GT/2001/U1103]CBZ30500.1 conserved hypothetical protein [Leishmania mexicana MHOM/GT/2001/U1103]